MAKYVIVIPTFSQSHKVGRITYVWDFRPCSNTVETTRYSTCLHLHSKYKIDI